MNSKSSAGFEFRKIIIYIVVFRYFKLSNGEFIGRRNFFFNLQKFKK